MLTKKVLDALDAALKDLKGEIKADQKKIAENEKQAQALLKSFQKDLRTLAQAEYAIAVDVRKKEREAKKTAREAAFATAKAAKEDAKAKLAAAKALVEKKPRGKKAAAKKAKGAAPEAKFTPKVELIKKPKTAKKPAVPAVNL